MKTMPRPSAFRFGTPRFPAYMGNLLGEGEYASRANVEPFVQRGREVVVSGSPPDDTPACAAAEQADRSLAALGGYPFSASITIYGKTVAKALAQPHGIFDRSGSVLNAITYQPAGVGSLVTLSGAYTLTGDWMSGPTSAVTITSGNLSFPGMVWSGEGNEATCTAFANLTPWTVGSIFWEVTNAASTATEEDIRKMESEQLLEELYIQVTSGRVSAAMDATIDHIDLLLSDGLFSVCNLLLARADLSRMPSSIRRAFLMMTKPAKEKLPARTGFYEEALRLLSQERGEEVAKKMLTPLA